MILLLFVFVFQEVNDTYDTYDSAIVCAESVEEAKKMHPNGGETKKKDEKYGTWCGLKDVQVDEIGEAGEYVKKGVIVDSFNAG